MPKSIFNTSACLYKLLLSTLLLLCFTAPQAEENKDTSWHQIEYIIFQHLKTDTHILRYEDTPYPKHAIKQFSYLLDNPQPMSPFQYTKLKTESMELADALNRIRSRRDIKLLDHGAWQQQLDSNETIPPLKIFKAINDKTSLFGQLQLKKSRYTHAEFTLYLADSLYFPFADTKDWFLTPQKSGSLINLLLPLPDNFNFTNSIGKQQLYFNIHHLQESRRIKQGEIHYLDHPVLGAIITINDIEAPEYAFMSTQ